MPDLSAIATRLREAREARGMSGRALCRLCGMTVGNVSTIESGRVAGIEVATVFRLADALGVRRCWLVTGEGGRDLTAEVRPTPKPAAP